MQCDIVIPTAGNCKNLKTILDSIQTQTLACQQVIIVCNGSDYDYHKILKLCAWYDLAIHTISIADDYPDLNHAGPSAGRMIGSKYAQSPYVYIIDDDNKLKSNFLAHSKDCIDAFNRVYDRFFLCPVVGYRDTWLIQSCGFSHYSYRQSRPIALVKRMINVAQIDKNIQARYPQMIWGNAICGRKQDWDHVWWDMSMLKTMEDIDWSMRASSMWYYLIVPKKLMIAHHERDKTILEQKFISSPTLVYHKSINRLNFVSKYGNRHQKIVFYVIGLPSITLYTIVLIMIYVPISSRHLYISALRKGQIMWIKKLL